MNTMMDASLPLTVGEYLEWGNPNEPAAFEYMRSYSPYDNLERKAYPAILVTTSINDSQVMYWEPTKYVAKLRTLTTGGQPLLLKCNMAAGHGGGEPVRSAKEVAFDRLAHEPGGVLMVSGALGKNEGSQAKPQRGDLYSPRAL